MPAGQLWHALSVAAPVWLLHVPRGHGWKARLVATAAPAHQPPAAHRVQLLAPIPSEKLPAGHASQLALLLPGAALYLPTAHGRQPAAEAAPATGMCVPAGHGVGSPVPCSQKWPAVQ